MSVATYESLTADGATAYYDRRESAGWATPGKLAQAIDPQTVQTPALDLIDTALVNVADGHCDRLIISMPPQEGKSQRVTRFFPEWLFTRNRDLRIAVVSYGDDIAGDMSYMIRTDVTTFDGSDPDEPDLGLRLRQNTKAVGRWFLEAPAKGGVYAVGIGGALTSKPVDFLIIDDPVKDYRAADSLLLSEAAWNWWMSVGRPRLAPGAPVVIVQTRWHESDLAGRLLTKQKQDEAAGETDYDQWTVINIPAQAEHHPELGETDPLGRQPGEFMESARGRTPAQWRRTKVATAPRIWSAMYQGRPSPDSGNVWQRPWWRRYDAMMWSQHPDSAKAWLVECDEMILSWDMAFKDTKGSDYVVGQVWARRGANVYLLDQVHKRLSFTDTASAFKTQHEAWPQATAKLVEDKANGTAVIDQLKSKIPGIIAVNPTESKYARANAVAPFIEAGNVWLPSKAIALFDVEAFIDETAAFPNTAHDDQVDAASQALGRLLLSSGQGAAFLAYWKKVAEERGIDVKTGQRAPADPEPEPTDRLGVDPLMAARNRAVRAR